MLFETNSILAITTNQVIADNKWTKPGNYSIIYCTILNVQYFFAVDDPAMLLMHTINIMSEGFYGFNFSVKLIMPE